MISGINTWLALLSALLLVCLVITLARRNRAATRLHASLRDAISEREDAVTELELQAGTLKLRERSLEAAGNGILIVDAVADGYPIIYCNPAYQHMAGRQEQELIGETCPLLVDPAADPATTSRIMEALENHEACEVTLQTHDENGATVWDDISLSPVRDESNVVTHFIIAHNDVTEHKRAQTALQESESRFKHFAETSADWHWETDRFLKITYIGKQSEETTGLPAEKIIGRTLIEMRYNHLKYSPEILETHLRDLQQRKAFRNMEYPIKGPDGEVRIISSTGKPLFDDNGKFTGYRGAARNVTDSVRTTEAMRHSEVRFRDFAEAAADWFWETDSELRLTHVSEKAEQSLGLAIEDIIGQRHAELLAPHVHGRTDLRKTHLRKLSSRQPYKDYVSEWVKPDGQVRILVSTGKPTFDNDGVFSGYRGVTRDITEYRRIEEEARRHRDELAHASRVAVMGELVFGIAHELNQPLAAIASFSEAGRLALENGTPDTDQATEALNQVNTQSLRAGKIVERLRRFVNKGESERVPVDINGVMREVLDLIRHEIQDQGVSLKIEFADSLPGTEADRIQIEQVALNLVRNAIEAMTDTGQETRVLTVRTARADHGGIEVAVSDTGEGLPDDASNQLFEPFISHKQGGMGMGLSISRSIIEAHGGRLWAMSNPDCGATFQFTLPAN